VAYVRRSLAPGERLIYRARFNWTYDAQSALWFALGLAPTAMRALEAAGVIIGVDRPFGAAFNTFAVAAGAVGFLIVVTRSIHKWTTIAAVTDARLILKVGLISRATAEIALEKIESVMVRQTILGRVLGYGRLTVHGAGVSVIEFPDLAEPAAFRRHVEEAVSIARVV
jgi:uncharacterized membrane protein YdbT with pleckstrin-like domain